MGMGVYSRGVVNMAYELLCNRRAAWWILILTVFIEFSWSTPIDNGVVGEPTITCGSDEISIWVNTQKFFDGKIYVKGEYSKPECGNFGGDGVNHPTKSPTGAVIQPTSATGRPLECPPCPTCAPFSFTLSGSTEAPRAHGRVSRQISSSRETSANAAHLQLAIGTCNMKRERSLNPQGVSVSVTVVISFHQIFITKVDKAYQVRCFYMEAEKTVTSILDVSMPQTTELSGQAIMPVCQYTIHRGTVDGPELKFAKVGDPVYHKWECKADNSDVYGMLVHSCVVDDGQGKQIAVINDRGCSVDKFVIGDLNYHTSLLLATVESHVFKFADRAGLDFQCAINICLKNENGCEGITPPRCERFAKRNARNATKLDSPLFQRLSNDWNLHAQRLTVVDIDDNIHSDELALLEQKSSPDIVDRRQEKLTSSSSSLQQAKDPNLCLTVFGFGLLVSLCTFVFTLATVVLGTFYVVQARKL